MNENNIIFVSHCILNQNTKKHFCNGSCKRDILEILAKLQTNIIQLPCPEIDFKENGNNIKNYKTYCKKLSLQISKKIKKYLKANYNVIGILGVDLSRTCAVYKIKNGKKTEFKKGILIEEIEKQMQKHNFQIPIFSVNSENNFSTIKKLELLLRNS